MNSTCHRCRTDNHIVSCYKGVSICGSCKERIIARYGEFNAVDEARRAADRDKSNDRYCTMLPAEKKKLLNRNQAYRKAHKDKCEEYTRKYRVKKPQQQEAYRKANKDRILAYAKDYYQKNKEKRKTQMLERYYKNKGKS